MLNLNVSNRFEVLLKALLEKLALTNASVFDAEQIIVPSVAVKRYLAMAIADVFGVCAHVEFSFLAQWLWRQIARVMPGFGNVPLCVRCAFLADSALA